MCLLWCVCHKWELKWTKSCYPMDVPGVKAWTSLFVFSSSNLRERTSPCHEVRRQNAYNGLALENICERLLIHLFTLPHAHIVISSALSMQTISKYSMSHPCCSLPLTQPLIPPANPNPPGWPRKSLSLSLSVDSQWSCFSSCRIFLPPDPSHFNTN